MAEILLVNFDNAIKDHYWGKRKIIVVRFCNQLMKSTKLYNQNLRFFDSEGISEPAHCCEFLVLQ